MDKLESWKSASGLSFIPEICFALIAIAFFWLTIGQPENVLLIDREAQQNEHKHSIGFTPDVIKQAMLLRPGQLLEEGKIDQAVKEATELAQAKPYDVLSNICAGNVLCELGDKDEGFRLLKKAVALVPQSRYVRMNLAEKLAENKRYDESINQLLLILNGYPRWAKPHLTLAAIYGVTERPDKSAEELKLALDTDPNNGSVRKERAIALARSGQPEKGLEEFVKGDADELNFHGLPQDLKQDEANWGSIDRAEFEYRRQLQNAPDDPNAKLRLARILLYRGQTAECKTLLMDARRKAPSDPAVHRNLALVLQKLGDATQALSEFRISVSLEQAAGKSKNIK